MLFDLQGQGLQGWGITLFFLSEYFYKVFSTFCFSVGLRVLVSLIPVDQDCALTSALINIPLSGIAKMALVVMDASWGCVLGIQTSATSSE